MTSLEIFWFICISAMCVFGNYFYVKYTLTKKIIFDFSWFSFASCVLMAPFVVFSDAINLFYNLFEPANSWIGVISGSIAIVITTVAYLSALFKISSLIAIK